MIYVTKKTTIVYLNHKPSVLCHYFRLNKMTPVFSHDSLTDCLLHRQRKLNVGL